MLAWAGLLDGRQATTHWRLTEALARDFPRIDVREDVLYVDTGSIITSAGSATGMDMMLHMVRKDYGARVANLVAERLVLAPWRDAGRSQRVSRAIPHGEPTRLAKLMEWMRRNLREPHSLGSLAEQAALSQRTLQRQFLEATGLSPIDWLIRERVAFARELLETTDRPLQVDSRTGRLRLAGVLPPALPRPGRRQSCRVPQPAPQRSRCRPPGGLLTQCAVPGVA